MNKEIRDEWTAALLSGDYAQGTGALKRYNYETKKQEYCCLGVLCDLAEKRGLGRWTEDEDFVTTNAEMKSGVLPQSIADWAGLDSVEGLMSSGDRLTGLNDSGTSFSTIAHIITQEF